MISDTMINDTINTYTDLADNEAKQLIYSVSRLLFIQDKYKDDEIGQEIDSCLNNASSNIFKSSLDKLFLLE